MYDELSKFKIVQHHFFLDQIIKETIICLPTDDSVTNLCAVSRV